MGILKRYRLVEAEVGERRTRGLCEGQQCGVV